MRSSISKSVYPSKTYRTPKKRTRGGGLLSNRSGKSNVWTPEERADLFNRRQIGEDWETICRDYPTRTRHAMQQQYSVEKRKHEGPTRSKLAPRRGTRKPRAVQTRGHNWTSVNKMPLTSDEEMIDYEDDPDSLKPTMVQDDDGDTEYEDISHAAEESSQPPDEEEDPDKILKVKDVPVKVVKIKTPRPAPLARSATEPSARQKASKKNIFPNLPASAGLPSADFEAVADQLELSKRKASAVESDNESRSSSHQSKRPKCTADASEGNTAAPKSPYAALTMPDHVFTTDEILRAQERAKELAQMYHSEITARREAFEGAQKRAYRRANEAEQKLVEAGNEYALKLKFEKEVIAKDMSQLKASNEEKQATIEGLEKEVEAARLETQSLRERPSAADDEVQQRLAAQESQLKLYDQLRASMSTESQKPREKKDQHQQCSQEFNAKYDSLAALIDKLNADFEDMSNKAIARALKELQESKDQLLAQKVHCEKTAQEMMDAVEGFITPFAGERPSEPKVDSPKAAETVDVESEASKPNAQLEGALK
ncbi:MAG: hypothetical protein Q9191_001235 [Dirinaria sp. TL-2023a]